MNTANSPIDKAGFLAALGAYFLWGLFPLYWKLLDHVPALEIMLHRVLWCFVFVSAWLCLRDGRAWLRVLKDRALTIRLAASSLVIGCNWYIYIWAINSEHIVETSLGYFINPLVNVALATLLLGERLNSAQKTAVTIAAAGVLYISWDYGRFPWIAFALAGSFAAYGLLRRSTLVGATTGLGIEGLLLAGPVAAALLYLEMQHGSLAKIDGASIALLLVGGAVTALPLVLFAFGAQRVRFTTIGMLQYLAPSLQLACGVFVFHEPFDKQRLIGFALIWLALAVFTSDGVMRLRRSQV